MKENLHFKQLRLYYINSQNNNNSNKTKQNKNHIRLVIVSIGVHVVAKTDGDIYALSFIKVYGFPEEK